MKNLIERFKLLKDNRRISLESRAKYVSLDVDLFLMFMSGFYAVFYLTKGIWFLSIFCGIPFIIYFIFLWLLEDHYDGWVNTCFISILIFTIVNTLFAGWQAGFQNFLFSEVVAIFLPNIRRNSNVGKIFSFATFFAITYFVLFILFLNNIDFTYVFPAEGLNRLYIINTVATFFTIMMFAFVYSTHSERRLNELSRRADFDELTKLYNRYAINQMLETYIEEYNERHKPFNVAILDIDFFKNVNDTYGHNAGDDVLKGVAKILKKYTKTGSTVGRWGGEEFIIIAPPNIDKTKCDRDLDTIRKYINSGEFVSNGQRIGITVSIGVDNYRDGWGAKEVVEAADKNLYRAKETGRNKIVY
jgi:diguanylate cyclase (GGDEF)-like protein